MYTCLQIQTAAELVALTQLEGLPPLDVKLFQQQAPDRHLVLIEQGAIVAHCSLWWRTLPHYPNHPLGFIGHYAAQSDAAPRLLQFACNQLAAQGCTLVIAPIDGNTWRSYRFITDRGTELLFFLEPNHPAVYPQQFVEAGFAPFAHYSSALVTNLTQRNPRLQPVAQRLSKLGVRIRSFDPEQFELELQQLYQLSLVSFRQNFLYTPISESEFMAQYSQIKPYIDPNLILVAEHQQRRVGFLFAIPNLEQAKRGEAINTAIIKTVAVLPERQYAGLGNVLVENVQAIAHQLGYSRAIHALMHEENKSRNLSRHYATPMRRYALFSKQLQQ